jgi:hypothetical protein
MHGADDPHTYQIAVGMLLFKGWLGPILVTVLRSCDSARAPGKTGRSTFDWRGRRTLNPSY